MKMMKAKLNNRGDIIKRMFPHTFRLDFKYTSGEATDPDDPFAEGGEEVTKTIVEGYPCSIQHATTSENKTIGGYVLSDQYVMLCPILPLEEFPVDMSEGTMTIYLNIRGKEFQIDPGQIKAMDTMETFEVGGYRMGTKFTLKGDMNLFI